MRTGMAKSGHRLRCPSRIGNPSTLPPPALDGGHHGKRSHYRAAGPDLTQAPPNLSLQGSAVPWCNGSTTDSESVSLGSNPRGTIIAQSPAATKVAAGLSFFTSLSRRHRHNTVDIVSSVSSLDANHFAQRVAGQTGVVDQFHRERAIKQRGRGGNVSVGYGPSDCLRRLFGG